MIPRVSNNTTRGNASSKQVGHAGASRPSNIEDVLAKLQHVKKAGDHYIADCPCRGHSTPGQHLSIFDAGDKALVTCFYRHDYRDICRALGYDSLGYSGARYRPEAQLASKIKGQRKLVAVFSYEVEKGREAFQIRRYDLGNGNKTFEAWHRTNDGHKDDYIVGMGNYKDKSILFHLPEIAEWVKAGKTIYLPEGEGKVEIIIRKGGAATTSPFGAGHNKWRPQYSEALARAKVAILPDNDKPGYDFAREKAVSLYGKAASVKVLELPGLPEKGDIVDWFSAGHTFEELERLVDTCPEYEPPPDVRLPLIVVTERHLRDITDDALRALYEANKPERIFKRSGMLTRINVDEKGRPFTEVLSEAAFRGYLERAANFVEVDARSTVHPTPPPLTVVRDCLSLSDWQFPPLLGVTEVPVIRPDGSVLVRPGYDATTSLYYYPSPGLSVPRIPDKPANSDVKSATELVLETICDFPFDSEASRANAIATMFTPVLRPMIDGPVPFTLVDKPQQGTGATLLAEVISVITTGRASAIMTARKDDEEWRKAITSLLLRGQLVAVIDNIEGTLYAPSLAAVLTATTFQDRILGHSELVTLPNRTTWIGTGNNIKLAGDLPRRCIWIRMDAKMARPWLRDPNNFKHPHLAQWVSENRGAILAATLTIAKAWVLSGRPPAQGLPNLGGYESYCRVIGGALSFMGIEGFLANLNAMYDEADVETPQWEGFLETWRDVLGDKAVTAAELISYLNDSAELRAILPDNIADTESKTYSVRLGQRLGKKNGVRYPNGFVLVKAGEKKRAVMWKVVRFQSETSPNFSFKGEVGEVLNTLARRGDNSENNKRNIYRGEVETTSPNLTLASKKGEVGSGELPGAQLQYDNNDNNESIFPTLDVTSEEAIAIWRKEGAPVIHLGPGENCLDLEKLLKSPNPNERQLKVIRDWLQEKRGEDGR